MIPSPIFFLLLFRHMPTCIMTSHILVVIRKYKLWSNCLRQWQVSPRNRLIRILIRRGSRLRCQQHSLLTKTLRLVVVSEIPMLPWYMHNLFIFTKRRGSKEITWFMRENKRQMISPEVDRWATKLFGVNCKDKDQSSTGKDMFSYLQLIHNWLDNNKRLQLNVDSASELKCM